MSNQLVGTVYHRVIEDVVTNSRVTFEEDGVDQQTLEDLRKTWQQNLSKHHVASFPWDPPQVPQPMAHPTTLPSNVPRQQQPPIPGNNGLPQDSMNTPGGVQIKNEPGIGYDAPPSGIPPSYGNAAAMQRAGEHLEKKFGTAASMQVNQLQARAAQAQQPHDPSQVIEAQRQQRQFQQLQEAQLNGSRVKDQTDGAADWSAFIAQRRAEASGSVTMYNADMTIREHVQQVSQAMEGGGLMLPLSEHPGRPSIKKRKLASTSNARSATRDLVAAQTTQSQIIAKISQVDGVESDDDKTGIKDDPDLDDDEDAINSDLDDPDDDVVDDTEDDGAQSGQLMLCTYDKVQRVKNKWKCTLKDGVLTTGGKEYIFHKASGEFEW